MSVLTRKLLRDAWHWRAQLAACAVVLACGVAAFVALFGTYRSLLAARDEYYARHHYAEVFAHLKRAPNAELAAIAAIPGVATLMPRVVAEVPLRVPGLTDPARARLVSLPPAPALNRLQLLAGRWPEPGRDDEVIASAAFMQAHGFRPGVAVEAVIRGRLARLQVVGVAISPEFIYEVGAGQLLPDSRRFGVFWMDEDALAAAFDMRGAFNDLVLSLAPGARLEAVKAALDARLARWGGLGATGRDEQVSHRFISDEIAQNRVSASLVPGIFLAVAAFLLHTVLQRLVQLQRTEIGLLKAFGYGRGAIAWHTAQLALLVAGLGAALGLALGLWMARGLLALYADYYRFPSFPLRGLAEAAGGALALAAAAALLGALGAARVSAALAPAVAMRPPAPAAFARSRLSELPAWAAPATRMAWRQAVRRPWRAALSVVGIAVAAGLIVLGGYFRDAFETTLAVQFEQAQREDLLVILAEPRANATVNALAAWPGVQRVEGERTLAVRVRAGHRQRLIELQGLPADGELLRVVDLQGRPHAMPAGGLLVSARLAEELAVRPGDRIEIESLEGERRRVAWPVAGVVDDALGLNAYGDRAALGTLAGDGDLVNRLRLRIDAAERDAVLARLKQQPTVSGVLARADLVRSFRELLARNLLTITAINLGFACVIAAGLVYNGARIGLSERGGELATLRVLGYTQREASQLLLREQTWTTLAGVPLGLGLGAVAAWYFSLRLSTELYRLPFTLSIASLALAAAVVLVAAALSGWVVARRVAALDLVAVLKTRE